MPRIERLLSTGMLVALAFGPLQAQRGAAVSGSDPHSSTGGASEDTGGPAGLPAGDWSGIRAAHEASRHAVRPLEGTDAHVAPNHGQRWTAHFDGRGFTATPDAGAWTWGLALQSYGFRGHERSVVRPQEVRVEGTRMAYAWSSTLEEWYLNDARGLEHGYTVRRRPDGGPGPLRFTLAVRGELLPEVVDDGSGVRFVARDGTTVLTYSGLVVFDAHGDELPARFESLRVDGGAGLLLTVEERDAAYPLTIDPLAQQAYLKASNSQFDDQFGRSVSVSGDTVVVGALWEDSNSIGVNGDETDNSLACAGAAYVFVRNGTSWSQQAYLKASNTNVDDNFGASVAVSGDIIVVGAAQEDSSATGVNGDQANNDAATAGAAYVFVRNGATWSQEAYLKASNAEAGDQFGHAVAVSGDTVVVTAPAEGSNSTGVDGDQADNSLSLAGAAYVFVRNGATWSQEAYLKASNTDASDVFGFSVAVSDDTIVVGAIGESSSTSLVNGAEFLDDALRSGAAYVFRRSGTSWSQEAYLKASDPEFFDEFGNAVSVSGDTVVVGARGEDSDATGVDGDDENDLAADSGAAYVFERSGTTWSRVAYLKASNTAADDDFGWSVAVSGGTVVVGAKDEDSGASGAGSASNAGAAYVFGSGAAGWTQRAYLKASNAGAGDQFGWGVAASDGTLVVGAPLERSNATGVNGDQGSDASFGAGAAYVFTRFQFDDRKFRRFTGPVQPGGTRDLGAPAPLVDGSHGGRAPRLDLRQAGPGEAPSLRIQGRGGARVVLWLGTERIHDGERVLVRPTVDRRLLVLDGQPGSSGSLELSLDRLLRPDRQGRLFAQVAVLDSAEAGGFTLGPAVELRRVD